MSEAPPSVRRSAGILLVDKPTGPTSHDVVDAVRRALGTRRVGHFGTLDPFATGLLVCGVGPATRLAPFVGLHSKTYRTTLRMGWTSTTGDPEGELTRVAGATRPDREAIEHACRRWSGSVEQMPPAYSAKHVGGERAHALARRGEAVALEPVRVDIESIVVERYAYPDLVLRIECGPGTYVRALARDLGEALGTGAYCLCLRRLRSGPFRIECAQDLDELGDAPVLLPAELAVADLPSVRLDQSAARAMAQGRMQSIEGVPDSGWVRLRGPCGFLGLGEVEQGPGGPHVQPRRILFPDGDGSPEPGPRSRDPAGTR